MIGLSVVNRESKSLSVKPCGCSLRGCSLKRSTTLMKRILMSGNSCRNSAVAAKASCVGISPAEAITRSGSPAWSLLAVPDADAFRAVRDGFIHIQILQVQLFVRNNHVDVVLAAEAVIGHRQQAISVRGKINTRYRGAFVENYVQKPWVLMREAVVLLPPDRGRDK